jgi:hypothetical protein
MSVPNRKFYVEVSVRTPEATIINRQEAKDWPHTLRIAREMATGMFPEDPMSNRTFNRGVFFYQNHNDFGDEVVIRPIAVIEGSEEFAEVKIQPKVAA